MKATKDDTLLTPENHALLLIDHQYLQLLALRSHPNEVVVNNAVFLAKAAKVFEVPTLFTTAFAERQALFKELQAVFQRRLTTAAPGFDAGLTVFRIARHPASGAPS